MKKKQRYINTLLKTIYYHIRLKRRIPFFAIKVIVLFLFFIFVNKNIDAQTNTKNQGLDSLKLVSKKDSLYKALGISKNGLDSTIYSRSKDTISLNLKFKKMFYRGEAHVDYKHQILESEIINIDFEKSIMEAVGIIDSTGKPIGFPIMDDKGQKYAGEKIKFNFKTQKGIIAYGETNMDQAFYFGERIKRVSKNEYFIQNGYYTTCDHPEPHFHFGADRMKFIAGERVFLEPVYFYIEDLPIAVLPIGLFFNMQGGRQSGIMIPSFYFSNNRGVVFKDFGFYWAASDFWDTQLKTDIYTKGGFLLKSSSQWRLRDVFDGDLTLEYGRTKTDPDDEYNTNWRFNLRHNHKLSPSEQLDVNLDFATQNFNRNTYSGNFANSRNQWIQQDISSRASFSKNFENKHSFSISYDRNQNIINESYHQNSRLGYSIPTSKPLNNFEGLPRWVRDFQSSIRFNAIYDDNKDIFSKTVKLPDTSFIDTSYKKNYKQRLELRPNFSISPKLGYFTLTPSFNYSANMYRRQIERFYTAEDSTMKEVAKDGLFYEHEYSLSAAASTKIYGIVDNKHPFLFIIKPEMIGVKAFRHTYQPNISFNWSPDQSKNKDYYGLYENAYGDTVLYSRFEADGGGIAHRGESFAFSYNDRHVFEMKVPQGDTLPDKNYELLALNFGFNYNFAADSLKMSDVRLGFRTPSIKLFEFSGGASFTPYDENIVEKQNQYTGQITELYQKVNRTLLEANKGVVRLTNLNFSFSANINSNSLKFFRDDNEKQSDTTTSIKKDTSVVKLGERFKTKYQTYKQADVFGESCPGYSDFLLPWNLNFGLTYNLSTPTTNILQKNENLFLNIGLNFTLAETWIFRANTGYDLLKKEFRAPMIALTKDLHCWDMQFNWTPFGSSQGFYLRVGIKASQLRDIKIEKQNNPLMR